jgi:hypothetical protein
VESVRRWLGDPFFRIGLHPGQLIALGEWLHSPVFQGSTVPLRSGMALQVEEGTALADEELRRAVAATYRAAWERIERRRAFR